MQPTKILEVSRLVPEKDTHKSYWGKALLYQLGHLTFLRSYDHIIAMWDEQKKVMSVDIEGTKLIRRKRTMVRHFREFVWQQTLIEDDLNTILHESVEEDVTGFFNFAMSLVSPTELLTDLTKKD